MAQSFSPYSTGSVTATNGSPTVTGSGTTWTDLNASAGSKMNIQGVDYVIQSRDSATQVTLTTNYAGSTGGSKAYVVRYLVNPTAVTAGETVSLSNGITVEINNSAYSANGVGTITITYGTLLIKNTSTSSGITFTLQTNAIRVGMGGRGQFETSGNWISIGTGNGNASQTATLWTAEYCPALWIETGSGTGVYEKYLNLTGSLSTTNHPTLAAVGAGKYGRYFTQSGTTVTFGDGTNGKCPPNGANIRQPNICVTFAGAYTTATANLSGSTQAGTHKHSIAQFSKHNINLTYNNGSTLNSISCLGLNITQRGGKFFATDVGMVPGGDAQAANEQIVRLTDGEGELTNCFGWCGGRSGAGALQISNCILEFTNCEFHQIDTSTSSALTLLHTVGSATPTTVISGGVWVGMFNISGSCDIKNIELAANPRLVEDGTSTSKTAFTLTNTAYQYKFDGITVPTGGGFRGNFMQLYSAELIDIRNVTINSAYFADIFGWSGTVINNFNIIGMSLPSGGRAGSRFSPLNINARNFVWQNITSTKYDWTGYSTNDQMIFGTMKKVPFSVAIPGAGSKDISFQERLTSSTAGVLNFVYQTTISDPNVTVTGTAICDKGTANGWTFPLTGDQIEVVCPAKIYGISSLDTATATNTSTIATEYAIDTGSGYGSWTTLNTTNISAETVDKNTGFNLKVRTRAIGDGDTTQIGGCSITTTQDPTVLYPLSVVTLTLDNVVSGSSYYIFKTSGGAVVASGTASGTTVTINNIDYSSDTPVTIRVRKAGYVPFETGGTILSTGMNTWVSQQVDSIYQ